MPLLPEIFERFGVGFKRKMGERLHDFYDGFVLEHGSMLRAWRLGSKTLYLL